jgi:hypothetical protein
MIARVDFPEPRIPARTIEASLPKSATLPVNGVSRGDGVLVPGSGLLPGVRSGVLTGVLSVGVQLGGDLEANTEDGAAP